MNLIKVLPKFVKYKFSRVGLIKVPIPFVLTYSVTNMCQSKCKTCKIWKLYIDNPEFKKNELKLDEIEKIFKSIGPLYFFNISGGEPYLRKDLVEIVDLACKYLKPEIIHIPTNALLPKLIENKTKEILEVIQKNNLNSVFTIKPSFDGIKDKHDKIRGVKGNFNKVLETIERLNKLKKQYPNLHVGLGTVISKYNLSDIKEIVEYSKKLNIDTYINEIAEQRSELFNLDDDITPQAEDYKKIINYFSKEIKKDLKEKRFLSRVTQAFRLVYYDLVSDILKEKKQIIPCYAGFSNVHINPYGEVWPCCILGYEKSLGNLKEVDYNFRKIWYSEKANNIRKYIKQKKCYCPLANQAYSNILVNFRLNLKVLKNIIFLK